MATWRAVTRQLLVAGILHADAQRFGAITLTESARPVLKGETTLMLRRARKLVSGKPPRFSRSDEKIHLDIGDLGLFESLREWRSSEAKEQGVPAYVILHDRTLREIAQTRPATRSELLNIPGIGAAKAERYGSALMKVMDEAEAH